jgi:hypothetical protein
LIINLELYLVILAVGGCTCSRCQSIT